MLVFLALSVAVSVVSAQYGSNNPPAQPSYSNNVYYPPAVYDSHYWDYSSRERHHKQCPKLTTFVGELPGFPDEAFYPPVIRYVKYGGRITALVSCDRDTRNINFLFARHNSSRDIRKTHMVAMGSTAGVTLKCNRDERRFEGVVIDLSDTFGGPGDFSKTEEITQLTCLGLDKTALGLVTELAVKYYARTLLPLLDGAFTDPSAGRKKRDTGSISEGSGTPAGSEIDEAATQPTTESETVKADPTATETEPLNTDAPLAQNTDAPAARATDAVPKEASEVAAEDTTPAPGSPEAMKAAAVKLGKILGRIFSP